LHCRTWGRTEGGNDLDLPHEFGALPNSAAVNGFAVLLFDLIPAELLARLSASPEGLCGGLGGVFGPLLLGYLFDKTGSFFWGFVALGSVRL
jgi:hypothetical protein